MTTDYVIYDKANDHMVRFSNGDIILYGSVSEALEDVIYGNEEVVKVTDLSLSNQYKVRRQINKQIIYGL